MDTQKKIYSARWKNKNKGLCAFLMGMGLTDSNGIELVGQGTYVTVSFALNASKCQCFGKKDPSHDEISCLLQFQANLRVNRSLLLIYLIWQYVQIARVNYSRTSPTQNNMLIVRPNINCPSEPFRAYWTIFNYFFDAYSLVGITVFSLWRII